MKLRQEYEEELARLRVAMEELKERVQESETQARVEKQERERMEVGYTELQSKHEEVKRETGERIRKLEQERLLALEDVELRLNSAI